MRSRNECWRRLILLVGPAFWLGVGSLVAGAAEPDLRWSPEPFVFEAGSSTRYIDFDNGDDAGAGTKARPWKHHPWDEHAEGEAAACKGIHTYCFKRGVVYRGALVARDSGEPGNPIRLTVDPSWGTGNAGLYGSRKIAGGWKRCTDAECPEIPESGRNKTWYIALDGSFVPRLLWEVRGDKVTRIPIARTPNWKITDPDDPRGEWWELTGAVFELQLDLDGTEGFQVGDRITGTGRWEDVDEDRDNIAEGRNRILKIAGKTVTIQSRAWKKGELQTGAKITNGKARATIEKMSHGRDTVSRLKDDAHLTQTDPSCWVGATLWSEGASMPIPAPSKVTGYDPKEHSLRIAGRGVTGPKECCRYYLENLPALLDGPAEYYYAEKGEHAGRLFVRLPDDRDPNESTIEAARHSLLIHIQNKSHVEISDLDIRFSNCIDPTASQYATRWRAVKGIHVVGSCSNIGVRHCRLSHLVAGVSALPEKKGDVLDFIEICDNDIHDIDGTAIGLSNGNGDYLLKKMGARLIHVKVLRNRIINVGYRRPPGLHAVSIRAGELVEIARNVVDKSWGAAIWAFNGGDYRLGGVERPLIRVLIHHNKATNTLLGLQDYGGIASWMGGPSYVYNNISGNAVGLKHHSHRTLDRKDWYRTSCYGVGIYLDGQYKAYAFNNIIWGKNNNVNDRIYNSCAFNEAMGFMNTMFNNTMYCCGVGLHKGMTQHNRCYYLGNLMLDIGHKFIQQEVRQDVVEHHNLAYAKNVFNGQPPNFGRLGGSDNVYQSLDAWRKAMKDNKVLAHQTGILAPGKQVKDAKAHDFRLAPDSVAVDHGARVFVPWGLYAVVGEWGFYKHPADPSVILGENVNFNSEWYYRNMYQDIPRNDLKAHGVDASNFKMGELENWTEGALELNGQDEYAQIEDNELKKDWSWTVDSFPSWYGSERQGTVEGATRETVDMGTNNFLIEVVFKTRPELRRGGLVCKCGASGYVLEVADDGTAKMSLHFGEQSCSRTSTAPVNDGKWHHVVAEIDRAHPQGINIYVDGRLSNGAWIGTMVPDASLSNTANFTVGKTLAGAAGPTERYFAGQIDFLRLSRGTLKDAETTIEELHAWEFDGPFLKDFYGRPAIGKCRDAGAVEGCGSP